jgi:glycerate kinase
VEALVETVGGESVRVSVCDPLMRPIEATYGIVDNRTAVIEMASASGLTLLSPDERNPLKTTTFGTGQMIRDALERGCRRFLVGIGGSATNDAGVGMLQALGFRFFDADSNELGQGGEILSRICTIDTSAVMPELAEARFTVACDVTNPFSGPRGAAYVFAPQKGADPKTVALLDEGLSHFAEAIKQFNGVDINDFPGAGAAGGLGGGFKALLDATLVSGIEMVLDALSFRDMIKSAELIITGEGKLDAQTAMGKAPRGVLDAARAEGIPVVSIGGAVEDADELNRQGFAAVFPILPAPATLEKAMEKSYAQGNITRTVTQIMMLIKETKS